MNRDFAACAADPVACQTSDKVYSKQVNSGRVKGDCERIDSLPDFAPLELVALHARLNARMESRRAKAGPDAVLPECVCGPCEAAREARGREADRLAAIRSPWAKVARMAGQVNARADSCANRSAWFNRRGHREREIAMNARGMAYEVVLSDLRALARELRAAAGGAS